MYWNRIKKFLIFQAELSAEQKQTLFLGLDFSILVH